MTGVLALLSLMSLSVADPKAVNTIEHFASVWAGTTQATYGFRKGERLRDGTVTEDLLRLKYRKPEAFYIAVEGKDRGQEVLYDSNRRSGELLVHKGRFPDLTLWLDIGGRLTLKRQRHPVTHSGFTYLIKHLAHFVDGARQGNGVSIKYGGEILWEGETLREVTIKAPLVLRRVAAQKDEALLDFARRVKSDAYRIFEVNPSLDDFRDRLKEGVTYSVPTYYVVEARLLFRQGDGMLRAYEGRDASGNLLEHYRWDSLNLEPGLSAVDFSEENPAYRF